MKRILLSLSILTFPLIATISRTELVRTSGGYKLSLNGVQHEVNSYDIDVRLKSLNQDQLSRLAQVRLLRRVYQLVPL